MRKRGRMSKGHSRHSFRQGAMNVHPLNQQSVGSVYAMRGGIRL